MVESLNASQILANISTQYQRYISDIEIHQTLESTNTFLLNLAKKPIPSGFVCLAEEQTQGRGRQGKQWQSPAGQNVYCSLLWNFPIRSNVSNLSLAIGVIISKALKRIGVAEDLLLKWPNDVYINERKLAGVLIETTRSHADAQAIVIGIGLNVLTDVGDKSICLKEVLNKDVSRNKVVGLLLEELVKDLPQYIEHGFKYFLPDYAKLDMLIGRYVVIRQTKQEISGIAQGVNSEGELILRDQLGKTHSFRCGEVSVIL